MSTATTKPKLKRVKRVFSSHQQVCHVWAQQVQPDGRASNIFFTDTTDIYSYGYHYLAARVHTSASGKRFALVRSDPYSTSTGGHLGDIRSALHGLMPFFSVPGKACVVDVGIAVDALDAAINGAMDSALARKFFADNTWRTDGAESEQNRIIERIEEAERIANELRTLLGMPLIKADATKLAAVNAHLSKLVDRYNSPERAAKRAAKAVEREEERARKARKWEELAAARKQNSEEALANFRAGLPFGYIESEYDLLRIRENRIETSRRAEVPLKAARDLLKWIDGGYRKESIVGERIGHFTVQHFGGEGENEFIQIGCHRILLSEAREVLGA